MQKTAAGRRAGMEAEVRKALSDGRHTEFGKANARCGFTVTPTSGVTAIVTFQGPPPETHPAHISLALYADTLLKAGFWAEAKCAAGYVIVEVLAGPATAR